MKVKHIIILFLLGYILELLGGYFKIMQLMGAQEVFTVAISLKVVAAVWGIWKMFTLKNSTDILNA
ncbi:gliding motility protein GldL [Lentimicrobium sp. S6]|uniref:gliding motility protein GldL n=1 Tax=Lentimicrobium sp. S6 TaxID=2735872 RepID=UPI001554B9F0|nr:gliding motility protein GldL [Lentimicrobium sp. S6]NPD45639.1 gliding motility protein GldL [Lentimicrobium sp. S6]